jgi:hypothetical protein
MENGSEWQREPKRRRDDREWVGAMHHKRLPRPEKAPVAVDLVLSLLRISHPKTPSAPQCAPCGIARMPAPPESPSMGRGGAAEHLVACDLEDGFFDEVRFSRSRVHNASESPYSI